MAIGELYVGGDITELTVGNHSYNWWSNKKRAKSYGLSFVTVDRPNLYMSAPFFFKGLLPEELL